MCENNTLVHLKRIIIITILLNIVENYNNKLARCDKSRVGR